MVVTGVIEPSPLGPRERSSSLHPGSPGTGALGDDSEGVMLESVTNTPDPVLIIPGGFNFSPCLTGRSLNRTVPFPRISVI
jgi:hypothetical protein